MSQDSFLERNLQAREIENLRIIQESEENIVDDECVDEDYNLVEKENNLLTMDEANFKQKVRSPSVQILRTVKLPFLQHIEDDLEPQN